MAARPSWDGFLKVSLISVPVRAYSATVTGHGKIGFHLLHAKCGERIRYKKVCPVHGDVANDEIVKGYEFSKGEYVTVEDEEFEKLRTENDKGIDVQTFVDRDAIDPLYFSDRSFYLVPSAKVGQHPYAVLHKVMTEKNRYAVARVVISGKEQLAIIRPVDRLLAMTILNYDDQVKKPKAFEDEAPDAKVSVEEEKLAENLVDASTTKHFDLSQFGDLYQERLGQLLEAKAKGRKIVVSRHKEKEPAVINLMDALRKSLDATGQETKQVASHGKSRRRKAAHSGGKKKTG